MPNQISDREYVLHILDAMEGNPNNLKAKKISTLLGVRIRQRLGSFNDVERIVPSRLHAYR
jgi:predicted nucleic acid-binding OB-fold protein